MVDVFDIDTGAVVGSFEHCLSPNNLKYHPLRDEVWVRCSEIDGNSTNLTHFDVFSASNPSGEIQTNIYGRYHRVEWDGRYRLCLD